MAEASAFQPAAAAFEGENFGAVDQTVDDLQGPNCPRLDGSRVIPDGSFCIHRRSSIRPYAPRQNCLICVPSSSVSTRPPALSA